jgi:hypothetical protein
LPDDHHVLHARTDIMSAVRIRRNGWFYALTATAAGAVLALASVHSAVAVADSNAGLGACVAAWNGTSNHVRHLVAPRTRIGVVAPLLLTGAPAQHHYGCEFTLFGPKYSVLVDGYWADGILHLGRLYVARNGIGDAAPNVRVAANGTLARIR